MRIFYISILFFAFSCNQKHEKKEESNAINKNNESVKTDKQTSLNSKKEDNLWVDQFKEFRLALFHKDKNKLDQFFDFPIQSDKNELWILIDDKGFESFEENQDKPISKELFYKNIDKIFPKEFIQLLLKVKSDSLRKGSEYQTEDFTFEDGSSAILYFDFSEKGFSINFNSKGVIFESNEEMTSEFSIIYNFSLNKSNQLKFESISLAG